MEKLISVIVPVYNGAQFLPDCMRSLTEQNYTNLQIILIDDGSTDSTLKLCQSYGITDRRVMVLSGPHGGISAARNRGLSVATGEYVFFLDCDDAIHPQLLRSLVEAMEQHRVSIAGTRPVPVPSDRWYMLPMLISRSADPARFSVHRCGEIFQKSYRVNNYFGNIAGVMLRRELIGDTRFVEELDIGEDHFFIYQNLAKCTEAAALQQRWYYFRQHIGNTSVTFDFDRFWKNFLRMKLKWQSEQEMGRRINAVSEKRAAYAMFLEYLRRNQMNIMDQHRMCEVMKQHRKQILPALKLGEKLRYRLTVYFPSTHRLYCQLRSIFTVKKPSSFT